MKFIALLATITVFGFNSFANVDFTCVSENGTIKTEEGKSIGYTSLQVEGNEVSVAYQRPLHGFVFKSKMKKLDDLTFYKVQRGECSLIKCLLPSTILGYDIFEFEINQKSDGVTLKQHFVDSPRQSLTEANIRKHLTVQDSDSVTAEIVSESCYILYNIKR